MLDRKILNTVYERLFTTYGPQYWWPANSAFEILVGAILTQNTAWSNVEKAIANLVSAGSLNADIINTLPDDKLAEFIRPSGYFNIKAKRLKNFCRWFDYQGGFESLEQLNTQTLRISLLEINGIGPETADDILLYAFNRPVFVIDTYTRRLFSKLNVINGDEQYETLREWFEKTLTPNVPLYNEYHALIVRHAKEKCLKNNSCRHCKVEIPI
jgi:endonuclease-3 related protein